MVESVDTKDLKSFGLNSRAGSSPASSTIYKQTLVRQILTRACLVYIHKHFTQITIRAKNFIALENECTLTEHRT